MAFLIRHTRAVRNSRVRCWPVLLVTCLLSSHLSRVLSEFSKQPLRFGPKGVAESDGTTCIRPVENLGTTFRRSAGSKLIAEAVSHRMIQLTLEDAPDMQRGPRRGRQLPSNMVDLTFVRACLCAGLRVLPTSRIFGRYRATALHDFVQCFPRCFVGLLFCVLMA